MNDKCPKCGSPAREPTPIRIQNDGDLPTYTRIIPTAEWACGSWTDNNGFHQPLNTCRVAELETENERLRVLLQNISEAGRNIGKPGGIDRIMELTEEAAEVLKVEE